jgi:hypothetical protein
MINSVRNTVLSVLNKNNYGYISPSDFNLFAKQAQLDIFDDYFYQYNYQINKENARQSGTGLADIKKGYEEVIEIFSETKYLTHNTNNTFFLPAPAYTSDDYYLINKVLGYETIVATGTITTVSATQLIDVNATFKTIDVQVGDIVFNLLPTAPTHATVTNVVNGTTLDLSTGIFSGVANLGAAYVIFKPKQNELEKVTHSKITMLNNSMLTAPSRMFPAYTQEASLLTAFPSTLTEGILCQYIRYPKDPKWTYVTLTNGEPMFDSTQPDFQDFELSNDDQVELVNKILQYAGMSIREIEAVQFGKGEETMNDQKER